MARLLLCCAVLVFVLAASPDLAYAGTPPGPCHAGREGEPWSDPDQPDAGGEYECKLPREGFPGAGEWGWYQTYPPFERHPNDPTPRPNGNLQMTGGGYHHVWLAVWQSVGEPPQADVAFTVTAAQDPAQALDVWVYWDDGSRTPITIPQGSGTVTKELTHTYYIPDAQGWYYYWPTAMLVGTGQSSLPAQTSVEAC